MSGRSLRRLPVLAQARHMGILPMLPKRRSLGRAGQFAGTSHVTAATQVEAWLDAMERVIDSQALEKERLAKS